MQTAVWKTLVNRAVIAHGGAAPPPASTGDFGFYHDWTLVLEVWDVWREHGTLPGAGGWLDQDEHWRRDLLTMDRLYLEAWLEHHPATASDPEG